MLLFLFISLSFLTVFTWVIVAILRRSRGDDNDSDGGIEPWQRPPHLDLPPGVSWPIDDSGSPLHLNELEEDLVV
ncbi:MAG TPA: hypothetical protein DCR93_07050 [Cytophagales bacterium]|nr:hypothetical protein [Cytophagales bacterium]HAP59259.1 hypothetical protein [Cytophagales bacterium]